ncbi:MAG: CoA-binding protein [Bacteroidia bacterium]|nr:CoA-binding protein [Bacteroidia bacterium]
MKKTLVIGASPNPDRYAYMATEMLSGFGHAVVPFGIKKGEINGKEILKTFPSEEEFDTVTLYVNPVLQKQYEQAILDLHPKRVVFNPGTENPAFKNRLEQNGIQAIEACTLVLLRTHQY